MASEQSLIVLNNLGQFVHQYGQIIDMGFLVFVRILAFTLAAPVLGRKDFPFTFRLNLALLMTVFLMSFVPMHQQHLGAINSDTQLGHFVILIFTNAAIGFLVGFIGNIILETITTAGSLMNNQVGLSSAMMFDPATRQQVTILDKIFSFIGIALFFHFKGLHWMIAALQKTFVLMPAYLIPKNIAAVFSMQYLVYLSAQLLDVAILLVAPVFIVTIAVDLVLGIVNRTAPQIQVFQLSFTFKPLVGLAVMWVTLPQFLKVAEQFLLEHYEIFH